MDLGLHRRKWCFYVQAKVYTSIFSVILKGNNLYDFLFTDMSREFFQSNLTLVEEEKVSVCRGGGGG